VTKCAFAAALGDVVATTTPVGVAAVDAVGGAEVFEPQAASNIAATMIIFLILG